MHSIAELAEVHRLYRLPAGMPTRPALAPGVQRHISPYPHRTKIIRTTRHTVIGTEDELRGDPAGGSA